MTRRRRPGSASAALRLGLAVVAGLVLATACNGDSRAEAGGSSSRARAVPSLAGPDPVVEVVPADARAVPVQHAVVAGQPYDCPSDPVLWKVSPDLSECLLDIAPCPVEPVIVGPVIGEVFLESSWTYVDREGLGLPTYPGFCELRVLKAADPVAFAHCKATTGFAVEVVEVDELGRQQEELIETVEYCRLLKPAECPAGVRIDVGVCRTIQRRGWSCPAGYRPMNEYNRCYQPPPKFTGTVHPACGAGALTIVVQECADYVGDDFYPSPGLIDCAGDYPTADPPDPATALSANSKPGTSSDHWCEFNQAYTKTICHDASPPPGECAAYTAMCLKRTTQTGGCSAIAKSIRCRAMEAEYRVGTFTEGEVRRAGCQPCLALPFSPVPPDCPDDLSERTRTSYRSVLFTVLSIQEDLYVGISVCNPRSPLFDLATCLQQSNCDDPARGALTWSSTHFSQVAVVNAPVIVSVRDIPVELRKGGVQFSGGRLSFRRDTLPYPVSPAGDFGYSMARFGSLDPSATGITSVSELVGHTGECVFKEEPQFQLTITEMWPDNPADLAHINSLIGSDALDWWNALTPAEQEARTVARGLGWWPSLLPADRDARVDELTEVVDCNFSLPVWCRWTPSRAGYFKISGAAAWYTTRWYSGGRRIMTAVQAARIDNALQDPDTRQTVADQLADWGATPEDVGLRPALDGVLPLTGLDGETRYSGVESRFSCAGTDIRVYCTGGNTAASTNYTETDPIGIAVHEVRVATRAANR